MVDKAEQLKIASNIETSPDVLVELAHSDSEDIRAEVAGLLEYQAYRTKTVKFLREPLLTDRAWYRPLITLHRVPHSLQHPC